MGQRHARRGGGTLGRGDARHIVARHARRGRPSASSEPRPKIIGSPPFSRATARPCARQIDQQGIDRVLRHLVIFRQLADVDPPHAPPGTSAMISGLTSRSCTTTSADWISRRAFSVSSSGSPGPAPIRWTRPGTPWLWSLMEDTPGWLGKDGGEKRTDIPARRPARHDRPAARPTSVDVVAGVQHVELAGRRDQARVLDHRLQLQRLVIDDDDGRFLVLGVPDR